MHVENYEGRSYECSRNLLSGLPHHPLLEGILSNCVHLKVRVF